MTPPSRHLPLSKLIGSTVLALAAILAIAGIAVAAAWTPTKLWGFMGSIISLGAILVYILVSAGVAPFFAREHRSELSVLRHVGIPTVAVAALTVPLWIKNGLLWPAPAHPYNLVPYLTLSWLAIGIAIVLYLRVRRPADLRSAGRIVLDRTP